MIYRPLGKSGIKISALSFGTMRWKSEADCHAIIARGIELGLNYLDTSTGYVDGQSITWCGSIARKHRDQVLFSSKSNWAAAPDADTVQQSIDSALKKAGLDYFDFYQLWGLPNREALKSALAKNGFVAGVRQAQKNGLIKKGLGFTFHSDGATFKAAVDSGEFLCATLSYSLLNRREEQLIDYAAAKGVGVIIMNPLAGGLLGKEEDETLNFLRQEKLGPWYGSLRFLLANKNITTSIVGFATLAELEQDMHTLENPRALTEKYRQDLAVQMAKARIIDGKFCTGCGYCHDCPHGFDPTRFMQIYRDYTISGTPADQLGAWIGSHYMDAVLADELEKCQECGACEKECPQQLKIMDAIKRVKGHLGGKKEE
jgi:predicted aldo/keto reductase-like oxidoreductase